MKNLILIIPFSFLAGLLLSSTSSKEYFIKSTDTANIIKYININNKNIKLPKLYDLDSNIAKSIDTLNYEMEYTFASKKFIEKSN